MLVWKASRLRPLSSRSYVSSLFQKVSGAGSGWEVTSDILRDTPCGRNGGDLARGDPMGDLILFWGGGDKARSLPIIRKFPDSAENSIHLHFGRDILVRCEVIRHGAKCSLASS